jgi:hypothetical protein
MVWIGSLTTTKAPNMDKLKEIIPEEYHEFMNLFREPLAQELSPHRIFDHQTRMKEGKEVLFSLIYRLLEKELEALRKYLDHMLEQGKITESDSDMGALIIFIPKSNRKL